MPTLKVEANSIPTACLPLPVSLRSALPALIHRGRPFAIISLPNGRTQDPQWRLGSGAMRSLDAIPQDSEFVLCATYESLVAQSMDSRYPQAAPQTPWQALTFSQWQSFNDITTPTHTDTRQHADHGRHNSSTTTPRDFATNLSRIHDSIQAGDVYQVNYTQRFERQESASELARRWIRGVDKFHPPFAALIYTGDMLIASLSPEEFITCDGQFTVSSPIKGTHVPGNDELTNAKNRAEHRMIVDLVRNDLHRASGHPATTFVDCNATAFGGITHLVSTIGVESAIPLADALPALAPAGSITGAPKSTAIELINKLEAVPRGYYCGAIGWGQPNQYLLNVPIRTATNINGVSNYHSGGGIVIDSDIQQEWAELQHKFYWAHV